MSRSKVAWVMALILAGNCWARASDGAAPAAGRALRVAVEMEPVEYGANGQAVAMDLERELRKVIARRVTVVTDKQTREIARGAWAGEFDALWVPANLAVEMLSRGYESLGFDGRQASMAVIAGNRVGALEVAAVKGARVVQPQEDSLAGYVMVAMLSERNVPLAHFAKVTSVQSYEIAGLGIATGIDDLTAMRADVAKAWVAANPGKGRIVATSPEIPQQILVARTSLNGETKAALVAWASAFLAGGRALVPVTPEQTKYLTHIARYTPDELAGVQKIAASDVAALVKEGAQIVDVRTAGEYAAKHITGAKLVPYTELSGRVPDGRYSEDNFNVNDVGAKQVIYYCNGPECWKSYKAAKRSLTSGAFSRVYWLRGGLPEWERAGLPVSRNGDFARND